MTASFTPGPYTIEGNKIIGRAGELVATVENEADLTLLAEAWAMLDVLKGMSLAFVGTYAEDPRSDYERDTYQVHQEARAIAIITAVEGRAP